MGHCVTGLSCSFVICHKLHLKLAIRNWTTCLVVPAVTEILILTSDQKYCTQKACFPSLVLPFYLENTQSDNIYDYAMIQPILIVMNETGI